MTSLTWRCALSTLVLASITTGVFAADTACAAEKPKIMLAVRLASYYDAADEALAHAASCGFKYVFMSIIKPEEIEATQANLAKHGLKVAVFRGDTDLSRPTAIDELAEQLATCEKMGVRYMFLSPKHEKVSKEVAIEKLRKLGDIAKKHGVTVGLETHPDLGTNGDVHVETMKAINHPNIRVNFDSGNITYYNKGRDAVSELKKCIDYVGTAELKDHNGELETWNFPVLGKGIVDFPGVVKVLKDHGYAGPVTLEIEGVKGVQRSKEQIKKEIAESAAYVRSLGLFRQSNLAGPDYFMLVGYFVLMLGIGVYFYRYMRGMKDYFTGGNTVPWWLSGVSFYMSSFSVSAFISYPALCYLYGWVGVTALWVAVPATLFSVLLFAKKWRRARIESPVEYIETRYNSLLRQLFAWQGVPVKIIDDGLKLVATSIFVSQALGVDMESSMIACGVVILLYTFMGGLWAVAVTDFIQFVVLTVAIIVVLPLSIHRAMTATGSDSIGALIQKMPEGFFNLTSPEYNWVYIILLIVLYCLAWSSINWALVQRYYCVRGEKDALKTGWLVVALYVIGPPMMFLPAMAATKFLSPEAVGANAGAVYPQLCIALLPAGMLGLMIAAMFSATMSSLSGDYNVCASVLTNDVYRRLFRPRASQRELVLAGRIMTGLVGAITLGAAFLLLDKTGEKMFRTMVTLFSIATAPVAVPMLLGLVSKKVTTRSAVLGFLGGLSVGVAMFYYFGHGLPTDKETTLFAASSCSIVWNPTGEEIVFGSLALKVEGVFFAVNALVTLVVMLVTSALFPMSSEQEVRVEAFYKRLHTPIGELDEDRHAMDKMVFSPFRVVGICVAIIGLMLLGVLPWMNDGMSLGLAGGLGLGMALVGSLITWKSRRFSE